MLLRKNYMKNIMLLGTIILFYSFANAKQYQKVTLEKILSAPQLETLGVSKMNYAQKEALRTVLIKTYSTGYEAGRKKGIEQAIAYQQQKDTSANTIESQIDGDFEGFEGETIFKLMNGQIWQQTEYWYHYHYSFMPKVIIYKSGGGYKMKVDGVDKAIGVTLLN